MPKESLTIDQMLIQIRNALGTQEGQNLPNKYPPHTPTKQDTQSIIKQSLDLLKQSRTGYGQKRVKQKIKAAKQFLRDQKSPLVKDYIQEKISSQLFADQPQSKNFHQQLQSLKDQKQRLLRIRQQQIAEERKSREQIIRNIKEQQFNPKVKIPVLQIDRLIYEEEPTSSYLISQTPTQAQRVNSVSNKLKNSNLPLQEVYALQKFTTQQTPNKKTSALKQSQLINQFQEYQVIESELQSQNKYQEFAPQEKAIGLRKLLLKKPKLVKIIYCFIQNQAKINTISGAFNFLPAILKEQADKQKFQHEKNQKYSWKNKPKKYKKGSQKYQPVIQKITQQYRFKGIAYSQSSKLAMEPYNITERRISKMIGQSRAFHPKKCILSNTSLTYFEEDQKGQEIKTIQFPLQVIKVQNAIREEGSFLSKKEQNIQVVNLKGKTRNFKFQKNFLEGHQIYESLLKIMAQKCYDMHSKMNGTSFPLLFDFIHNPATKVFGIPQNFLLEPQQYYKQQSRQLCLQVLLSLFPFRSVVDTIFLFNSGLVSGQLSKVLNQCKIVQKIKAIDLSTTRVSKQNFNELCQLINQSGHSQIKLKLSFCKLQDQTLSSVIGPFTAACSKIEFLDISFNNLTVKSLTVLKSCLQNITCGILYLVLDGCPLRDIFKLYTLIKQSRKLEILSVQGCELELDRKSVQELERFWQWARSGGTTLKTVKMRANGKISKAGYEILATSWTSQTLQDIQLQLDMDTLELKRQKSISKPALSGVLRYV